MRPSTVITYTKRLAINPTGLLADVNSASASINSSAYKLNPPLSLRFDGADSNEVILSSNQHVWDVKLQFTRIAQGQWFGQRLAKLMNPTFGGFFTESFQLHPDQDFGPLFAWFMPFFKP